MPKRTTNKEELVQKSLDVFLKNGYYHATFSELAKACEVDKPLFYYYFSSKEDLMKEVLRYFHQHVEEKILAWGQQPDVPPQTRLKNVLQAVFNGHSDISYGCFMGNTLLETVNRDAGFRQELLAYFDRFKEVLTQIYASIPHSRKPERRATDTLSRLQGSIMLMRLYQDASILEDSINQTLADF